MNRLIGGFVRTIKAGAGIGVVRSGSTVTVTNTAAAGGVTSIEAVDGSGLPLTGSVAFQGQQGLKVEDSSPGVGPVLIVPQWFISAGTVTINGNGSTTLFTGLSLGVTFANLQAVLCTLATGNAPAGKGIRALWTLGPTSTFDLEFDVPPPTGSLTISIAAFGHV